MRSYDKRIVRVDRGASHPGRTLERRLDPSASICASGGFLAFFGPFPWRTTQNACGGREFRTCRGSVLLTEPAGVPRACRVRVGDDVRVSPPKEPKPVDPGVLAGLSRTRPQRRSTRRTARPGADAEAVSAAADAVRDASSDAGAAAPEATAPKGSTNAPVAAAVKAAREAATPDAGPAKAPKAKGAKGKAKDGAKAPSKAAAKAKHAKGKSAKGKSTKAKAAKRASASEAELKAALPSDAGPEAVAAITAVPRATDERPEQGNDAEPAVAAKPAKRRATEPEAPASEAPAKPLPPAGYATPEPGEQSSTPELVATALQAAGEVTRLGSRAIRGLLSRLPKP